MIPRRLIMVVAATIAITVFAPVAASACRIDNDTPGPGGDVSFWFDCGVACGNYFQWVGSGESVSRPGKAGRVQAGTAGADVCETGSRVSVGAHGEVAVTYHGPKADPDDPYGGMIPGTETFTWVSKGGNDWTSPVTNKAKEREAEDGGVALCWSGTP